MLQTIERYAGVGYRLFKPDLRRRKRKLIPATTDPAGPVKCGPRSTRGLCAAFLCGLSLRRFGGATISILSGKISRVAELGYDCSFVKEEEVHSACFRGFGAPQRKRCRTKASLPFPDQRKLPCYSFGLGSQ